MAVVTSKEFNQRASAVLKLSETEPVYITKWGKVVSVLANYAYYHTQAKSPSLAEAFSHSSGELTEEFEHLFSQTLADVRQENQMNVPALAEWE